MATAWLARVDEVKVDEVKVEASRDGQTPVAVEAWEILVPRESVLKAVEAGVVHPELAPMTEVVTAAAQAPAAVDPADVAVFWAADAAILALADVAELPRVMTVRKMKMKDMKIRHSLRK